MRASHEGLNVDQLDLPGGYSGDTVQTLIDLTYDRNSCSWGWSVAKNVGLQ